MIHEVDECLRKFVRRDGLPGNEVEVAFDAPTKDWASRRSGPVVDLYLYDIREDMRRRMYGEVETRNDNGFVDNRNAPPRWFKLSYLVTAWTQRPEDEHRLLSVLLACFLSRDAVPRELLTGSLADMNAQIPYTCALPPPQDRALSDVWSALGGELKPSLDLVVVAPFDLARNLPVGPPVEGPLGLDLEDLVNGGEDQRRLPSWPLPERADADGAGNGDGSGEGADEPAAAPAPAKAAAKAAKGAAKVSTRTTMNRPRHRKS